MASTGSVCVKSIRMPGGACASGLTSVELVVKTTRLFNANKTKIATPFSPQARMKGMTLPLEHQGGSKAYVRLRVQPAGHTPAKELKTDLVQLVLPLPGKEMTQTLKFPLELGGSRLVATLELLISDAATVARNSSHPSLPVSQSLPSSSGAADSSPMASDGNARKRTWFSALSFGRASSATGALAAAAAAATAMDTSAHQVRASKLETRSADIATGQGLVPMLAQRASHDGVRPPSSQMSALPHDGSESQAGSVFGGDQPAKRRRLGFLSRFFSRSSSGVSSASAAAAMPPPPPVRPGASALSDSAAAPGADAAAQQQQHAASKSREGSQQPGTPSTSAGGAPRPPPLAKPSLNMGSIYKIQDNALADDHTIVVGLNSNSTNSGVSTVPGLESPNYGQFSPAGGPDRLRVEPPVQGFADTSLSSPMTVDAPRPLPEVAGDKQQHEEQGMQPPAPQKQQTAARQPASSGLPPRPHTAAAALPPSLTRAQGASLRSSSPTPATPAAATAMHGDSLAPRSAAAAPAVQHPLEHQIVDVEKFINSQKDLSEEVKASALSQCQFLRDCLHQQDTQFLVGDSLLQLKGEVGFPWDMGFPMAGAPGWNRLVLQGAAAGATAGMASKEVLKVRWASLDQRQAGGANACAAITLEVAQWCLRAQRAVDGDGGASKILASGGSSSGGAAAAAAAAASAAVAGAAAAGAAGRALGQALGGFADKITHKRPTGQLSSIGAAAQPAVAAPEEMDGDTLDRCILKGTQVWQDVLLTSPATRVASATGDFDLEHMLQLGGYDSRIRLAEYIAASIAPPPPRGGTAGNSGPATLPHGGGGSGARRQGSTNSGNLPQLAAVARGLPQGVYVLGCHGHFCTVWLRPGGVVHVVDSLGSQISADCPLAYILEFESRSEFVAYFWGRHRAARDAGAVEESDIASANRACLVEVHRLELRGAKGV